MLKIKGTQNNYEHNEPIIEKIRQEYEMYYDEDNDYEAGHCYCVAEKDNLCIDYMDGKIITHDYCELDLLYDLIKDGLVEKVGE